MWFLTFGLCFRLPDHCLRCIAPSRLLLLPLVRAWFVFGLMPLAAASIEVECSARNLCVAHHRAPLLLKHIGIALAHEFRQTTLSPPTSTETGGKGRRAGQVTASARCGAARAETVAAGPGEGRQRYRYSGENGPSLGRELPPAFPGWEEMSACGLCNPNFHYFMAPCISM